MNEDIRSIMLLRAILSRENEKLLENQKFPSEIIQVNNLSYGTDDKYQVFDIYLPEKYLSDPVPVIINVHGGSWVYGDKEVYKQYCAALAGSAGFAVVNYSYRLAPENTFPAMIEDLNTVYNWILCHEKEYMLDADNIFAVGDSAGAHILSMYCALMGNREYRNLISKEIDYPEKQFKGIVLNCGIYSFDPSEVSRIDSHIYRVLFDEETVKDTSEVLNVVNHIKQSFPPVFVMSCQKDLYSKEYYKITETLRRNGNPFQSQFYTKEDGMCSHNFQINMNNDLAVECMKEELLFLNNLYLNDSH